MMITRPEHISCVGAVIVACALLTACGGGGAGSTEFVEACLKEGSSAASQMLDRELGVDRKAFCECGEPIAKSALSTEGYRAMVLDMQGKGEEARAITSKMNEAEQMASLEVLAKMMDQCGAKK